MGASQSLQRSSGLGESGCAAMPNPPSRRTSSTTSRASPASGYGERRHVERDVVTAGGADLHAVEAQHAGSVHRRVGGSRGVAVIGEHDERDAGACRRGRDLVGRAAAVGSVGVDVKNAAQTCRLARREREAARRQRQDDAETTATGDGRCDRSRFIAECTDAGRTETGQRESYAFPALVLTCMSSFS